MADTIQFEPLQPIDMTTFILDKKRVNKGVDVPKSPPFMEVLKDSVKKVNDLQVESDVMTNKLSLGEVEDISEVSIAVEKAELALRMMVQIRDKLVDAYQQISRMSV
ncbi:MAG: flagellar hook-basal body complex protein FliE [Synergistaceae bacterium]|jgi:flagellar hook-basal body complex protein FliE|nr:flagellar hook-basal body complex protein FliE [Synergistaceae bacterium]